ncbi:ImmA/IrrE family metallo-endopeptidase [Henriciella barbarensis]|uniref:ImmA/IrrE family metallo-endopeptidase n=1 Tax=Henriciella barbarensis TaxID=86342 RepID=A0A399QPK4_9PROT|nr:ImmA/IrrE family metallo-endopeptidase [Henriciella barbarensis]RIJ20778.1 ImmA/IrrE family metallo-endopeptidase [Henriciella barbarensis]
MNDVRSPSRWANDISVVLRQVLADDRFPIAVIDVASEISRQLYPDDAITLIKSRRIDGFEGMLAPAPRDRGKTGWGIFYNDDIEVPSRINFTLAHEFGHYLVHRLKFPDGIRCDQRAMTQWNSKYAEIESEANQFAASLLMPLDDFRKKLPQNVAPTFSDIGACASRYDVSLTAAILRWLEYTSKRAVLVASTDGFILWAKPSKPALKSGLFIRTRNVSPVPLPERSPAFNRKLISGQNSPIRHDAGVWFPHESCEETVLFADRFDFALSLLHFDDAEPQFDYEAEDEEEALASTDLFMRRR